MALEYLSTLRAGAEEKAQAAIAGVVCPLGSL
jgi:hypothetical protein